MEYLLSNGEKVSLYKNDDIAKFVMLKLPRLGLSFVGEVPHLKHTESVRKINLIAQRLQYRRDLTRRKRLEEAAKRPIDQLYDDMFLEDDYCPF